jgi:hypothetical protein
LAPLAGRVWLAVVLGVGACNETGRGWLEVEGAWADGEPIDFRQSADARREKGRVDVVALAVATPRFIGVRVSYDPARITAPGTYAVDPEAAGQLEIYCILPGPDEPLSDIVPPDLFVQHEASAAAVRFDELPGADGSGRVVGTFRDLRLDRQGENVLMLSRGTFWAPL